VAVGKTIITEKLSYRAWQKQFGKSVGLRAPGMFLEMLRRTGASHGRHPARSLHAHDQTLAVLSWLWPVHSETLVAALASVSLWHLSPARPLLGVSGRLSGPSRSASLVCPIAVRRRLGRSGTRPAGSTRAASSTRERGANRAPKRRHHRTPERDCPKVCVEPHKSPLLLR
jgi:hypothetical protein